MRSDVERLHSYFEIDADVVWLTVENDLPRLEVVVLEALDEAASD